MCFREVERVILAWI